MRLWKRVLLLVACLSFAASVSARELVGHAFVRDDGSLLIRERVVHLYGIFIPETSRQCRDWIRPVRCAERAVLALDFIVQGFVRCEPQFERADGSLEAICHVERTSFDPGIDLAAYLIEKGWALARPEAPFEYQAVERIARARGRGVWGEPVDVIRDRRRE
ncbi:micrococcal nuclease-like nuclease [Thioflavicoccus mobilis 8321]|uniref:Micrococcal nuclease-like nuclease n=1 Tax=Thioflavicoccus mobilis 8321 TaxID=765912 RepID=L0GV56_9GAMM|nr:nuclease-like protein [Thioflavicoccus mobilis]AGA89712.1 micrococcal nuclease-like nuclease [Thioflavicoccus mobilis 8321]